MYFSEKMRKDLKFLVLIFYFSTAFVGIFTEGNEDLNPSYLKYFRRQERAARTVSNCPTTPPVGPQVFLTVSSLASTNFSGTTIIQDKSIELNWYQAGIRSDDWIGLYDHDPTNNPIDPIEKVDVGLLWPQGKYRTNTALPDRDLQGEPFEKRCIGYWIGYISAGSAIAVDCLKVQPIWMEENREAIKSLRVWDTLIPGSHDSGSYDDYVGLQSQGPVTRWVMTQEERFYNQLFYGIRYFDMRVSYYARNNLTALWLNHGVVRVNPLYEAIDDVKAFLKSTNEIIILDFHNFPVGFSNSFNSQRHKELQSYIIQELGDFMVPRSAGYDITLDDIFNMGKQLIAGYSDPSYNNTDYFWSGIPQRWANTMNLQDLHDYMEGYMDTDYPYTWAAMVEYTPTPAAVVLLFGQSLRTFADAVNSNVTVWVRDEWWDKANVIATDYFRGNNVIDVAITANINRAICRSNSAKMETARKSEVPIARYQKNPIFAGPRFRN